MESESLFSRNILRRQFVQLLAKPAAKLAGSLAGECDCDDGVGQSLSDSNKA